MAYEKWRTDAKDSLKKAFKCADISSGSFYEQLKENLKMLIDEDGQEQRRTKWYTYKSVCENVSFLDVNLSTGSLMTAIFSMVLDNVSENSAYSDMIHKFATVLLIVAVLAGALTIIMDKQERKFKYMSQVLDDLKEYAMSEACENECLSQAVIEEKECMKKKDYYNYIASIRTFKDGQIHFGTGLFIKAANEKVYLVTAAHVAKETTVETDVWLRNITNGKPFAVKLHVLNSMATWIYHPTADLAILEILHAQGVDVSAHILEHQFFESSFDVVPDREEELTMFGVLDVYTDLEFAPFTCNGKPASDLWIQHCDVTGQDFRCFLLDKPSTQGFSGGPVIDCSEEEMPKCYGLVQGTRNDDTGGKLCVVVHSAYIFELINSIEAE